MRTLCLLVVLLAASALAQAKSKKATPPAPEPPPSAAVAPPLAPVPEPVATPAPAPPPPRAKMTVDSAQRPRLAVTVLDAQGVPVAQALALTDAVVAALSERGLFDVVSRRDIETALGAERQRQLLGVCDGDERSCGSSLAQVLSAPFILSGQLSRIGTAWQLTLQTYDAVNERPLARANRVASSLEELQRLVPFIAAEATGSPLPPPPSRVLPTTMLVIGGATLLSGAVFGIITSTQERLLNDELCPGGVGPDGRCGGTALRPRSFYLEQAGGLTEQKWVSLGLLLGGAALSVAGLVLMPRAETSGRLTAVLVPTGTGVAVTGGFW